MRLHHTRYSFKHLTEHFLDGCRRLSWHYITCY